MVVDDSAEEIRLAKIGSSLAVVAVAGDFPPGKMTSRSIAAAADLVEVFGASEGFAPWHRVVFGGLDHPVK